MIFEVELQAFGGGAIRRVDVPDEEFHLGTATATMLELIYLWGQNDLQPVALPSVSVGDAIRLYGKRFVVAPMGFRELAEGEQPDVGPGGILEYLRPSGD